MSISNTVTIFNYEMIVNKNEFNSVSSKLNRLFTICNDKFNEKANYINLILSVHNVSYIFAFIKCILILLFKSYADVSR